MCCSPGPPTAGGATAAAAGSQPARGATGNGLSTTGSAADGPTSPDGNGVAVNERPSEGAAAAAADGDARSPPSPPEDLVQGLLRTPKYLPCR